MSAEARPALPSALEAEGKWVHLAAAGIILLCSALPVARLLSEPFLTGTSAAFGEVLRPAALRATLNTLETGILSALLALALGTGAALLLAVTDMRGKTHFAFLFVLSMLVAPQVVALAFKTLAGPASPLLAMSGLSPAPGTPNPMLSGAGIMLVLGLHHAPLAMLIVLTGLRAIPRSLIEAAQIDGARPVQLLSLVVLPVLKGHLVAAWLLTFVAAIGNFGIPALLGLPVNYLTLPTLIYRRMTSFGPDVISEVAVLSIVLVLVAGLAVLVSGRILARPAPVLEAGQRMEPFWRLGRARLAVEALAALFLFLAVGVPCLSLLAGALVPALGVPLSLATITLEPFVEVLFRQKITVAALGNSLLFAGAVAVLVGVLALPIAYAIERRQSRLNAVFRFLIELPYALPGVVIAIAMILLLLRPLPLVNISLYGTAWIIILAYLARFLPLGLKPVTAAIRQFDPAVEEAGALCGAGFGQRMRLLILPALLPALTAGMLFVFLTAFNELTVSALLWSANTRTLGVVLFSLDEAGLASEAAALGISTMLVVLVLMLLIERLRPYLPENAIPWSVE